MNSSKGYVPLSLAILLAASIPAANAGSALDPYAAIKPATQTKKKSAPTAAVPDFSDDQAASQTFTNKVNNKTLYMGSDHFEEPKPEKKGLIRMPGIPKVGMPKIGGITGGLKAGAGAMGSGMKKIGSASKDAAGATVNGMKSAGDKIADAKDSAVSKTTKKEKKESPNKTASKIGSVDDWYIGASKDVAKVNKEKVKEKSAEGKKSLAFMPKFGKKKSKKETPNDLNIRPASGFADAASNPDEEILAEKQQEKERKLAAKREKAEKEKFEPIVNLPEDNIPAKTTSNQVASTPVAAVNKPAKKSKFGIPKVAMPGIPGIPGLKKKKTDAQKHAVAAAPKKQAEAPVKKQIEESQVAIDPNEIPDGEISASNQFNTGDKEIDNAVAKSPVVQTPAAQPKKVAEKPAKKNKIGGMSSAMKGGFNKLNFLNKKKQQPDPQTANKADAPKQM